jgi:hypothetical protein
VKEQDRFVTRLGDAETADALVLHAQCMRSHYVYFLGRRDLWRRATEPREERHGTRERFNKRLAHAQGQPEGYHPVGTC